MLPYIGEDAAFARYSLTCRAACWNFLQGWECAGSAPFHVAATNHVRLVIECLQCG